MAQTEYQKAVDKVKRYDTMTWGHCKRVGHAAELLGKKLGKSKKECKLLREAGELHDIGKTKIPKSILNKKGRLTMDERHIMNQHVTKGVEILQKKGLTVQEYLDAAGYHHAWYGDASRGYKASEKNTPSETSQIMAIVDVYDALANKRSYKEEKSYDEILEIMDENAENGQFNPDFYETFVEKVMPILESERSAINAEKRAEEIMAATKTNIKESISLNESLCMMQNNELEYSL